MAFVSYLRPRGIDKRERKYTRARAREREVDVGIICVIIYDDLALEREVERREEGKKGREEIERRNMPAEN